MLIPAMKPILKRSFLLLALLLAPLAVSEGAAAQPIAFTGVTVIDVEHGSTLPDMTVVVTGNRITGVDKAGSVEVPDDASLIDASGKYLIPGLWDMHVHAFNFPTWAEAFSPLFLANGVTGVRDTWHHREVAEAAEAAIEAGEMAGPARIVVAGNLIDGPARIWPNSLVAYTPEQGRHLVDSLHAADAPFIKVYSSLTPETYLAIAERARELDIPFVGHVPARVRVADASDAGQRSMEHFFGVVEGCSSEEEAILAEFGRAMGAVMRGDTTRTLTDVFEERNRRTLATQDEARCRALADRFVRNETWQVPTLVNNRAWVLLTEFAARGDERLRYLPRWVYENEWAPWFPDPEASPSPDEPVLHNPAKWERDLEIIGMMAERGVPFLAGTDTPNPWAFPGFGLHDELALFVEAGMTPLEALRTATLNPARFFGRTDDLGTVEAGKLADLVLLDANPLEDITNTQSIRAVVADGRHFDREALDEMLVEVERVVQERE